jgi:hypothetical protein
VTRPGPSNDENACIVFGFNELVAKVNNGTNQKMLALPSFNNWTADFVVDPVSSNCGDLASAASITFRANYLPSVTKASGTLTVVFSFVESEAPPPPPPPPATSSAAPAPASSEAPKPAPSSSSAAPAPPVSSAVPVPPVSSAAPVPPVSSAAPVPPSPSSSAPAPAPTQVPARRQRRGSAGPLLSWKSQVVSLSFVGQLDGQAISVTDEFEYAKCFSTNGLGFECSGELSLPPASSPTGITLSMARARMQPFNVVNSTISGPLTSCPGKASKAAQTTTVAVVSTFVILAVVVAVAFFLYRRSGRSTYYKLAG